MSRKTVPGRDELAPKKRTHCLTALAEAAAMLELFAKGELTDILAEDSWR